jgi:nucleotide-binding universal stress UspA family protein
MGEPDKRGRQRRRPTLRAALEAAQKAGKAVKSATIKDGEVTLVFGEPTAAESIDEWDERLNRGKH